jgi:hypothetical protein
VYEFASTKIIDYFSLDVEGAEMIILQSIDWKHLDIDVYTIETDQHRQDILTLLKTHRYKWIQIILGDDLFSTAGLVTPVL